MPEIYETQFRESLKSRSYSDATLKTYRSMFRRMCRDLDETDLSDVVALLQYRVQMRTGSVGIFDALWGILRQSPIGVHLPSAPRKPVVIYPHPLFADVMLLGAVFGNERLPELTWKHVEDDPRFMQSEIESAIRCLRWATRNDDMRPEPWVPLVPKDSNLVPMQLWQVEYVINSPELAGRTLKKYAKEEICLLIGEFVTQSVRLNAPASVLRFCCDRAHHVGSLVSKIDAKAFYDAANAITEPGELVEIAASLPVDPADDTPAMW